MATSTPIPPGSSSSYTGPTLAIGKVANTVLLTGPNALDLESYDLEVPQLDGGF